MRYSILAFDLAGLLLLGVPSLAFLAAAAPGLGGIAVIYLAAILLGALCLMADLFLTTRRKADSANLLSLSLVGMTLILTPSILIFLQATHG